MRTICALMAGLLLSLASPAFAQDVEITPVPSEIDAASLDLARQIVDLGLPVDTREAIFFASAEQIENQVRDALLPSLGLDDPGAIAVFDDWMADMSSENRAILRRHIPSLMEGMARSYASIFTRQELTDILAFVSTSSGQRFFELGSAVVGEPNFAAANQAYMEDAFASLPEQQADLTARLMEYLASRDDDEAS